MDLLPLIELISSFFVIISIIFQIAERERSQSMRRIIVTSILSYFWLLSDCFCYSFDKPQNNYWINHELLYWMNVLPYILSSVVLISFLFYCEAYLNEKIYISKLVFRVPMILAVFNIIVDFAYFISGKLIKYDNGYIKLLGAPSIVLIVYVILLLYPAFIAYIKRKEVGIKTVLLMALIIVPILASILGIAFTEYDLSVLLGSICVVFIVVLLKYELKQSKLSESLTFTDYFLSTFVSAYYVDMRNMNYQVYKRDSESDTKYSSDNNYFDTLIDYIVHDVHPDDRKMLIEMCKPEKMKERLEDKIEFSHIFRDISGDVLKTYRLQVIRGADDNHVAFGFINISDEILEQNERIKEAEEARKLIESVTSAYNVAYEVNMSDDSIRLLRSDDFFLESKENFDNFTQAKDFFINNVLVPSDRKRLINELDYNNIRSKIAECKSYNVEYRALLDNVTTLNEMNVSYIDEDKVAIGFATKDLELTKKLLEEKRYNEYFALFIVDFDTERIKFVKNESRYRNGKLKQNEDYTKAIDEFADIFEGETRDFFKKLSDLNYVKKELAVDDKRTYSYKSVFSEEGKWVDVTTYVLLRHDDGTPAVFSLGFSVVDSLGSLSLELQSRLKADIQMIGGLASEYHTLYYFNIDENLFEIYSLGGKKSPDFKNHVMEGEDLFYMVRAFGTSEQIHPDDVEQFSKINTETIRECLSHCKKFTIRFRCNYYGEYLWSEMDAVKYEGIDEQANAITIGFAIRDEEIRKEQKQQKMLEDARSAAETASLSKSSFLFNMSHDIRTPMNAIAGFTTMAKKYADNPAKIMECLDKIETSGNQLLVLINQVLEMARIESGRIDFDNKPVNIRDKFNQMVTVLSEQARENGLEFHYFLEDVDHLYVYADEARMGSITLNVAGNAMKYTPEGGCIDYILKEIPSRREGYASYIFTVSDTGIGMSEEYLQQLYEPFSREKSSTVSKIQGTGLGMSIVKNIVDLMHGTINVQSEKDKGTKFDITLDFKIADGIEEDNTLSNEDKYSFAGSRVLLVEDNEMNREIVKAILEEHDLIVDEADDGDVAVNILKEVYDNHDFKYYDLILMDIQMPRMNGYKATAFIREIFAESGVYIPIIAMTANAFEEDRKNALDAGMDEHLVKPIDLPKLLETLAKFI